MSNYNKLLEWHKANSLNRFPDIPKVPGVYMITHLPTKRKYIGSSENVNKRLHVHTTACSHRSTPLTGLNFSECEFKFLKNCEGLTKQQRLEKELEFIINLQTMHPFGFNQRNPVTYKLLVDPVLTNLNKSKLYPARHLRKPYLRD